MDFYTRRQWQVIIAIGIMSALWLIFGGPLDDGRCGRAGGTWICPRQHAHRVCVKGIDLTTEAPDVP